MKTVLLVYYTSAKYIPDDSKHRATEEEGGGLIFERNL